MLTLDRHLVAASPIAGTESGEVERLLETAFDSPVGHAAVLVIGGLPALGDTVAWRARIRALVTPIGTIEGVTAVISPATSLDTLLASHDGTTALAIVGLRSNAMIDTLRAESARRLAPLLAAQPTITLHWTGQPALLADLRVAGIRAARAAEWRAVPATAVVALWALGVTGAVVALVGAGLVVVVTLGLVGVLALVSPPAMTVRLLVPLVGLALTMDYTLYLVRRGAEGVPREQLRRTVLLASAVAALGFAALSLAPTGEVRAVAPAGIVVAILSAAAALTLTVRLPIGAHRAADAAIRWRRWGAWVVGRPWLVIGVTALPLLLLALHARTARLVTPLEHWLPEGMESADAIDDLERADRAALVGGVRVLLMLPPGRSALTDSGWATIRRTTAALRAVPGVVDARSIATIGTGELVVAQHVLPQPVLRSYLSRDQQVAMIELLPDLREGRAAATTLVTRLRDVDVATLTTTAGARVMVGGLPAYVVDFAAATRRALPPIILAITLSTIVVLLLVLRAPLLVAKAVLLNLLVAAAAIGATVVVFQDGVGAGLIGLAPMGAILPTVPLIAFGAVFGLGMDYELFLLSGVIEARREGVPDREAIVEGLARTAPLITRAAAIMITLFVAFAASSLVPLAMIGFALAVAILLDATVVRLALAPAILQVAGRWNWWPGAILRR